MWCVWAGMRRIRHMMSQITSSTTERVFEYGALNTAMPFLAAWFRYLVRADAEAADGGQCGACIDDRSGHRGLGTYAKHVDTLERVDEFPFRERTLAGLHFESVGAKALRGEWMNVFQQ